jgi:hypothetical protein
MQKKEDDMFASIDQRRKRVNVGAKSPYRAWLNSPVAEMMLRTR